jgi:transcriptional regulator with GAF, ATPase, and Fis domain
MSLANLTSELASAARNLGSENVEHTLDKAVHLAVELIDGCDAAGVSVVHRRRAIDSPAYTDELVRRGDELQYELNEGPCLDAIAQQRTVASHDLSRESRWPSWGPRVVEELGVRSMLCIQLFTAEETVGALNMYSRSVDAFDARDGDAPESQALAAHIAVALASAQQIEHLHVALSSRTVIGQAEGILMERFDLSADHAFNVLQRVSSTHNIKLHEVAAELVRSRRTPE